VGILIGTNPTLFFFVKFSSKRKVLFCFAASSSFVVVAEVLIAAVGAV